ncbi:hypothetical protein MBLNU230_g6814t1 [Neophaeotheca triangularis]
MLSRKLPTARIPTLRPLRPPSNPRTADTSLLQPRPRLFTQNTQRLLVSHPQRRPNVPYLSQSARNAPTTSFLGPNPQLARLLSTETRAYVRSQTYLAAKWTLIIWTFGFLGFLVYMGVVMESDERRNPTPDEWSYSARSLLRAARSRIRAGREGSGYILDWARVGSELRYCLATLEDTENDGKGLEKVGGEGLESEEGVPRAFDVSSKSYPWRAGYFEIVMGCAAAAEHLDGMVADVTRGGMVFPKEVVIGPSNPDPRPVPGYMEAAPREENCVRPFAKPEIYYMRILTGVGFTPRQRIDAALGYANWLEFQGTEESAGEMYAWAVDMAREALPSSPDAIIDRHTNVLKMEEDSTGASYNLLRTTTAYAIHSARKGDVQTALPILLSVLRARRAAPVSPFPINPDAPATTEPKTDYGKAFDFIAQLVKPTPFPPPPPSGDDPMMRTSAKPGCEEAELMLYIGEILFATSAQSDEGLGWTRQAVNIADATLHAPEAKGESGGALLSAQAAREEKQKCRECLTAGLSNWETMLLRLREKRELSAEREGSRDAGWFEWKGWFGGNSPAVKGEVTEELGKGLIEKELERVEELKQMVVREGVWEAMQAARGRGSVWIA